MRESLVVKTRDSLSLILSQKCLGNWVLNNSRVNNCDYVVAVHKDGPKKGQAFFIGKVDTSARFGPLPKRSYVTFSEHQAINTDFHARSFRNPVHYFKTQDVADLWVN